MKPKIIIVTFMILLDGCSAASNTKNSNHSAIRDAIGVRVTHYTDPDDAFAIDLPEGWKAERQLNSEPWIGLVSSTGKASSTVISSDNYKAAKLVIFTMPQGSMKDAPADLKENYLTELGKPLFTGWLAGLKEDARVEKASKVYKTRLNAVEALRMDVTYYRGDEYDPRTGYGAVLLGNYTGFYIMLSGNYDGVEALEEIFSTLRIEPEK